MLRNGDSDAESYAFEIDNLVYDYHPQKQNQLMKVFDSTNSPQGFKDDGDGISDPNGDDYNYDANGNMTSDQNKGINNITYNHLNLPVEIVFANGKIKYLYTATGQKVKKMVTEGTLTTTTDYVAGFQYKNAVLQFFPHAEGYVNATEQAVFHGGTSYEFHYVFHYTDHLGNIRLSYSKDPATNQLKIIEENHYYPFGLKHSGYNSDVMMYSREGSTLKIRPVPPLFQTSYDYKYNGKELEDELGKNTYAYGWRDYDPAIGRFNKMDRFSEKYYDMTPYQYGANNPVVFNDIKGDSILIHSQEDNDRILYENGNLFSKDRKTGKWVTYNGKNVKIDKKGNKTIGGFLGKATEALDKIRTGGDSGNELINSLQSSSNFVKIGEGSNRNEGTSVFWDSNDISGGPDIKGKTSRDSYIGLTHELAHAFDYFDGIVNKDIIARVGTQNITGAEYFAMDWENRVRNENGVPLRTHYGNDDNGKIIAPAYITIVRPTIDIKVSSSSSGFQFNVINGTINEIHQILK